MIALHDGLPLVKFENGEVVAFQRSWLLWCVVQAAQRAGYPKWWLAEHVAESVTAYLATQCERNVIATASLVKAVRSVLQVIGYSEVAQHFVAGPPLVKISLAQLAHEAGTGYELAFFEMLGRHIEELIAARHSCFELFGLEHCVKMLRSRKIWSRDCDTLRAEIVSFVREQIGARQGSTREIIFSLS